MATTGGTTRARGGRAGCCGFKVLRRVSARDDGLLQFFYRGRRLRGSASQVGAGIRSAAAPLTVTTQVQAAAVGQLQGHRTCRAGVQLVAYEQSVAFNEYTSDALWGHRKNLPNNAFDDGNNAAH